MSNNSQNDGNIIDFPEAKYRLALKELANVTETNLSKIELIKVLESFGVCIDKRIFTQRKSDDYYIAIIEQLSKLLLMSTAAMADMQFKEVYQPIIDTRLKKEENSTQIKLFDTTVYEMHGPEDLRQDVANTNNKQGYLGVTKKGNKFVATIWHLPLKEEGRKHAQQFLGAYTNPIQAAQIRDRAAIYLHGEKAKLNFPILD